MKFGGQYGFKVCGVDRPKRLRSKENLLEGISGLTKME